MQPDFLRDVLLSVVDVGRRKIVQTANVQTVAVKEWGRDEPGTV